MWGTGPTGGGELLREERGSERERGRNSGSWFVSVSSKQRAYSTRLVSHALTHTCAHTLTDERTVYSDQQRVCWEAGSRKLTDWHFNYLDRARPKIDAVNPRSSPGGRGERWDTGRWRFMCVSDTDRRTFRFGLDPRLVLPSLLYFQHHVSFSLLFSGAKGTIPAALCRRRQWIDKSTTLRKSNMLHILILSLYNARSPSITPE